VAELADGLIVPAPTLEGAAGVFFMVLAAFPVWGSLGPSVASSRSIRARYSINACCTMRLAERDEVGSKEGALTRDINQAYKSGGSETPVLMFFSSGSFFFI
jgi:hypothetical protein